MSSHGSNYCPDLQIEYNSYGWMYLSICVPVPMLLQSNSSIVMTSMPEICCLFSVTEMEWSSTVDLCAQFEPLAGTYSLLFIIIMRNTKNRLLHEIMIYTLELYILLLVYLRIASRVQYWERYTHKHTHTAIILTCAYAIQTKEGAHVFIDFEKINAKSCLCWCRLSCAMTIYMLN